MFHHLNHPGKRSIFLLLGLTLLLLSTELYAANTQVKGQLVFNNIHSPSLEANQLGDSANRSVLVYLPPGYARSPKKRYPVVYLLHGNGAHSTLWLGRLGGWFINVAMDTLINSSKLKEMIIVMPDASNRYLGSQYANSSVSGGWADFIVKDLVSYIDANYRTLAKPESRGLAGHSMGGRGTWFLAMTHPDIFSNIYAMSTAALGFEKFSPAFHNKAAWAEILASDNLNLASDGSRKLLGYSVAFSPNNNKPPFYTDLPYQQDKDGLKLNAAVWKKWLANDPMEMLKSHKSELNKLNAIHFDCGTSGPFIAPNRAFSDALKKQNINHVFEEFDGNHVNKLPIRIQSKALPFFSQVLIHQ